MEKKKKKIEEKETEITGLKKFEEYRRRGNRKKMLPCLNRSREKYKSRGKREGRRRA